MNRFLLSLLFTPIFTYPLFKLGLNYPFIINFIILSTLFFVLNKSQLLKKIEERKDYLVFGITFLILLIISLSTHQLFQIGERIRDFSLLAQAYYEPAFSTDPWLFNHGVVYYVYWYKLASTIGHLFFLKPDLLYAVHLAFCYTLYFYILFKFFRKVISHNFIISILISFIIVTIFNLKGLGSILNSLYWWDFSRVITGAITEFPAWSFLFSDLHPHMMNLSLPVLYLFSYFKIFNVEAKLSQKIFLWTLTYGVFYLWINQAHPWDLVFILGFYLLGLVLLIKLSDRSNLELPELKFWSIFLGALLIFLYFSNIHYPKSGSIKLVFFNTTNSNPLEFLAHWGGWLLIILVSVILFFEKLKLKSAEFYIFSILAIGFMLLPEVIYYDDLFGADFERMNFIFKIYCLAWTFMGILFSYLLKGERNNKLKYYFLVFIITVSLPSFVKMYLTRFNEVKSDEFPYGVIKRSDESTYKAVMQFKTFPRGLTLQSPVGAYGYNMLVSSFGEKPSFFGSINLVNTLAPNWVENSNMMIKIAHVYQSSLCETKKDFLIEHNIKYLVISKAEMNDYKNLDLTTFSCLKSIISEDAVKIFTW